MVAKRIGFVLTIVMLGTGCALVSGLSNLDVVGSDAALLDGGATGDSAVDADSSTPPPFDAGEGGCGCGLAVPPGFSPILFADGKQKDDCPSGVVEEKIVVGPLSVSAPPTCSCGCTLAGCTNLKLQLYSSQGCSDLTSSVNANGQCQPANQQTVSVRGQGGGGGGSVTCASTPGFPKPHGDQGALCTPSSCASLCAPPKDYPVCFVAQGDDVSCPPAAPTRYVVASSVTDTRTCTGCMCAVGPNPGCSLALQWYSTSACWIAVGAPQTFPTETCTATTGATQLVARAVPTGTCTGGSGQGSGTTTPTNVRTVCCK